ncbi:protein-L-isoaspartate(D-aspartate) O-methyltransferase [Robiginitalea sediminis]|uniref:protein-L-isoaspartate(D-aspartate) O-methyltransferase n=1 Tax=Robiginitalea sediminis TaxID=1982593 RepID=UPI000B4BFB86|nr:protein-L-isoaspartate(D-aspartate) O-methyltransferase [Robiginitalea sediminis]
MKALLALSISMSYLTALSGQPDFGTLREQMVKEQLRARDITSARVLEAMKTVPRHLFVRDQDQEAAYGDHPLPIGWGQTISQPYMVAAMTQALDLRKGDKVLEVGTGSGYQAAVLAQMGMEVYTIEIVAPLGTQTKELLRKLGYDQVQTRIGDGYHGWPEAAPFDAIMVTAGGPTIPKDLLAQLREGGRMVIPLGKTQGVQELTRVTRREGKIHTEVLMAVRFVPFTRNPN